MNNGSFYKDSGGYPNYAAKRRAKGKRSAQSKDNSIGDIVETMKMLTTIKGRVLFVLLMLVISLLPAIILYFILGYDIKPFSIKEWNFIEEIYYVIVWIAFGMFTFTAVFTKFDKKTEKLQGKDIKKPESITEKLQRKGIKKPESIEDHIRMAKEEEKKHGGVINQYSYKRFL